MNKAKEILYKHAKNNGCKYVLSRNPFLEQAVLNAINEALTMPDVSDKRELLIKFCDALFEQKGIQITNVQIDFLMKKFNL